jgi:hypothetical protein
VDTCKDHIKSQRHQKLKDNAKKKPNTSQPRQITLHTSLPSKTLREEFILDFVKLVSISDIPLEKTDKMRLFLKKHCRQGGSLPQASTLRQLYVPRLFDLHFKALKDILRDQPVCIIADETTDVRDHMILNVVAGLAGRYFLIDVVTMTACNHATMSQAVIQAVTGADIKFNDVMAIVSDSAAYCKKAFKDVLAPVFPNATHVLCIAHILNLVGEVFRCHAAFDDVGTLVSMVKSAFFKKPGRKTRYIDYLKEYLPDDQVKLPPVPCTTRWNSWFEAVKYHATHVHLYEGFFKGKFSQSNNKVSYQMKQIILIIYQIISMNQNDDYKICH